MSTIKNMVAESTAIKEKRNEGEGKMDTMQAKKLWGKCQKVIATMMSMMRLMADSKLDTDWQGVDKNQRVALLEWQR